MNNLDDITLDKHYATLCGYTDHDIDTVFAAELFDLDREAIRDWYSGYNWLGEGVYNPFDVLQLFDKRDFRAYWFETGTPTFLIEQLMQRQIVSLKLDSLISSSSMLSSFDMDNMTIEALLFQAGYLTIKKSEKLGGIYFYTLGYPNREIQQSLNKTLLSAFVKDQPSQVTQRAQLYRLLLA